MKFKDRQEGGKKLATELKKYKNNKEAIILALPRGGVITGFEVAKSLNLPLDILVPRKIGSPENDEFAIGALTEDGEQIFNGNVHDFYNFSSPEIQQIILNERKEAKRRLSLYRQGRTELNIKDKIAIIIDDGIATGSTILAAIKSAQFKGAKKIIIAVPVSANDTLRKISTEVDEVICLYSPTFFGAVGAFYEEFPETEDKEVIKLMEESLKFSNNSPKIILVIAPRDFKDEEYYIPKQILLEKGVEVITASLQKDAISVNNKKQECELLLDQIRISEFDAIGFIGGKGSEIYLENEIALLLARDFFENGKLIAAICKAPSILANAGLLLNKKATAYPNQKDNLIDKGAIYIEKNVVVDGKIITAIGPQAAKEFGNAIFNELKKNLV